MPVSKSWPVGLLFNFGPISMTFLPKCRVLCLELQYNREQIKKGRGAAEEAKMGGPPLYIGLVER